MSSLFTNGQGKITLVYVSMQVLCYIYTDVINKACKESHLVNNTNKESQGGQERDISWTIIEKE